MQQVFSVTESIWSDERYKVRVDGTKAVHLLTVKVNDTYSVFHEKKIIYNSKLLGGRRRSPTPINLNVTVESEVSIVTPAPFFLLLKNTFL